MLGKARQRLVAAPKKEERKARKLCKVEKLAEALEVPFSFTAISRYCAKHSKTMDQIRNKKPGTVKKVLA